MSPSKPSVQEEEEQKGYNLDQAHVSALLENAPFRMFFKDRESRFIAVGRQKYIRHGCADASEMLGKSDTDYFPLHRAQQAREDEEYVMRTGAKFVGKEEKIIWPNGQIEWGLATKLPLRNEQGEIIGTFGYTEDITKEKELAQSLSSIQGALVDASRMAGMAEVATGVLHNVGNVLNSLNVSASIITTGLRQSKADSLAKLGQLLRDHASDLDTFLTEDPKGKKVPEFLNSLASHFAAERARMLQEVEAMLKNVDHIKEIVSMQQTYATVAGMVEPLDAAVLMEDALRMDNGSLGRHQINIIKDFQPVPTIMAEKGKVLQVIINLLRNGRHACDESGRTDKALTLRVTMGEPGRVQLIVQDNGIGIPAENILKIFQHGFTTKSAGHGFGIHSSANAAKEMKGSLTVKSDGPGQGATFILDLPVAETYLRATQTLPL